MKIGILTLTLHTNYGGILQAYALQTVLERMGHEVIVLNNTLIYPKTKWKEVPRRLVKKLLGRDVVIFKERRYKKEAPFINHDVELFRKHYIHERMVNTLEDIASDEFDCIVVGSDQVWRPLYFKPHWRTTMEHGFLSFTKGWNIKRISYAASFGVDKWEYSEEETQRCKESAQLFDAISVRERTALKLTEDYLGIKSQWVLDPTLLLDKEDYCRLIDAGTKEKKSGNLLVYILDRNAKKMAIVEKVANVKSLTPFSINNTGVKETATPEEKRLPSVETWLRGFRDAAFVVTDSFHACVFSIIFNKPFVVVANEERGVARFNFLKEMLGLENNVVSKADDIDVNMDYSVGTNAYELLNETKKKSIHFLEQNIGRA